MRSRWKSYVWPAAWGLTLLAGLGAIALQWHIAGQSGGESVQPPARILEANLLPVGAAVGADKAGEDTLARPLFVPSRRPSPPAVVAAESGMKRGQFSLVGTIRAGDQSQAFLKEVSSGKVQRVPQGGRVSELTLSEVGDVTVTLSLGEQTETLTLKVAKGPPPPPPTSAARAPAPGTPNGSPGRAGAPVPAPAEPPPAQGGGVTLPGLQRRFGGLQLPTRPRTTPTPAPGAAPEGAAGAAQAPTGELTFAEIARQRARDAAAREAQGATK